MRATPPVQPAKPAASRRDASNLAKDMASTFTSLHYHIIFSTKERAPIIDHRWRSRLLEYLGGTVNGLGGFSECVGGIADHVHLLVGLKATHCLSDFMRELKKASSLWVHGQIGMKGFAWQEGYGAFTVSAASRDKVREYIANQEEHHRTKSFREELEEFLKRAGVKYEPKWLD